MHESSFENMKKCHDLYASPLLAATREVIVVDVGSANVNGTYRPIFEGPNVRYVGIDLAPGDCVDLVVDDPYRLPLDNNYAEIVLSGQMLEHSEFFWLAFQEMVRVLKPGGFLFIIVPSAGYVHRYPVDCYRFNPDACLALAKYAGCRLVDQWRDHRKPWKDLVGVFTKDRADIAASTTQGRDTAPFPSAVAEAEISAGSEGYLAVLKRIHDHLKPPCYLEIGVGGGHSLALATGTAIGVDPAYRIDVPLSPGTRLFAETADAFFAEHAPTALTAGGIDLTFISGACLFEQALRTFINIERFANARTVVAIDDIAPNHPLQASRQRVTRLWTGDVWKLLRCLRAFRPDLILLPLDASPTGLLVVANLDPGNTILADNFERIVERYGQDAYAVPPIDIVRRQGLFPPDTPVLDGLLREVVALRAQGAHPRTVRTRLALWVGQSGGSMIGNAVAGQEQKPVVLLGSAPHAEGLSALARALVVAGARLPAGCRSTGGAGGFWECPDTMAINERVLAELGLTLRDPRPRPEEWRHTPAATAAREEIVSFLWREMAAGGPLLVIDPRLCALLPLWLEAVSACGAEAGVILCLRDPAGIPGADVRATDAWAGWLRALCQFDRDSRGANRAVVDHAALVDDPAAAIEHLGSALGLAWPVKGDPLAAGLSRAIARPSSPPPGRGSARTPLTDAVARFRESAWHADSDAWSGEVDHIVVALDTLFPAGTELGSEPQESSIPPEREPEQQSMPGTERLRDRLALAEQAVLRLPSTLAAPRRRSPLHRRLLGLVRAVLKGQLRRRLAENRDIDLIARSGLFDGTFYYRRNPDVARARVDPLVHFVRFGAREGRDPCPGFETRHYLAANPDVARTGMNAFVHFIRHGLAEGRRPCAEPPPEGMAAIAPMMRLALPDEEGVA